MESQNITKFFVRADTAPTGIAVRKSVRFAHIEGKISYDATTATLDIIPPSKIKPKSINLICDTLRKIDTEVKNISIGSEHMKHELHKKLINVLIDFISDENYQIRKLSLKNIIITSEFEALFTAIGSNQTLVILDLSTTYKNSYSFTPKELFIKPDLLESLFLAIINHPNLKSLDISGRGIGFNTKITKSLSHLIKIIAATDKKCNLRDLKILDESNFWPNPNAEAYTQKQIDNINKLHAFVWSMLILYPSISNVDILEIRLNQTLRYYLTGNALIDLASKTLQNKKQVQEKINLYFEVEDLQSRPKCLP